MRSLIAFIVVTAAQPAAAATYSGTWTSGFSAGTVIPDGSAVGWSDVRSLSIPADQSVTDINVSISLSGGWNGDLYAYLSHPGSAGVAVLINRPGRTASAPLGYGDSILTITLDDKAASGDLHNYQSIPGYASLISNGSAWQPDGRSASPFTVVGSEPRTAMLATFDGMFPASGGWTLFIADLAGGDQHTIASWSLTVTTVPEPHAIACLAGALSACLLRRRRSR